MKLTENSKRRLPYLIGIIALLYMLKPSILFKPNGKPRQYGVGYDDEGYKRTLYTFQLAIIVSVVFIILVL
jgi:hypothetical protein